MCCAEHLLTTYVELVEYSLSEQDLRVLRNVLDEIWDVLLTGSIPDTRLLNTLDVEFMGVKPDDSTLFPLVIRLLAESLDADRPVARKTHLGEAVVLGS